MLQRCLRCKKKEALYRKIYYIRAYGELIKLHSPNNFYICVNEKCPLSFKIVEGVRLKTLDDEFEWFRMDFWS